MKIAICGLDCAVCPAYVVHQTGDMDLQKKTAEQWAKEYGADIKPEMVDCVGCVVVEGPHIGHCFECEIRKCGLAKGVENCAVCTLYPCATVSVFIDKVPQAKTNLEKIRAEAKPESVTMVKVESKSKAKAKPKAKPKTATKSKAKPKAKAKTKAGAKAKVKPKTKPKSKAKAKGKVKAKAKKR